jgi:hypothetical protein
VELPRPFLPIESSQLRSGFEAELARELKSGHPLFNVSVKAIGRREDQDDVLFQIERRGAEVAEVHLTWSGKQENPPWPMVTFFETFAVWAQSVNEEGA